DLEMARDPSVVVFGLDVDDPKAIQGTTRGLLEKYGPERVFGTPLSEDAMTGAAIGMALAGLRPIHVHIRMAFLLLAMNQLLNVEHRLLHFQRGPVPEAAYTVEPGKARVPHPGDDVTVVGISYMQTECLRAAKYLEAVGVRAEVIDPIWLSPLDLDTIAESVERTGRLLVVDSAWTNCGAAAEIVAQVAERLHGV